MDMKKFQIEKLFVNRSAAQPSHILLYTRISSHPYLWLIVEE